MNNTEILRDFRRRYEGTFTTVVFPDSSEKNLFKVESIQESEENLAVISLFSPHFGKIMLNYGTAHSFRFEYPHSGVYQHEKDAYIFRRIPARQYQHGICPGNSRIAPVWALLRGNDVVEMTHELVESAFKAQIYSLKEAVNMLSSGKYRSVALRDNFSLMLSMGKDAVSYLLLYWSLPVGTVSMNGEVVWSDAKFQYKGNNL